MVAIAADRSMSQPGSAEAADEDDAGEEPAHMSDFLAEDDDNDEQHPSYLDDGAGEPDEEEELLRDPAPGGSMARGRQGPRSSPSSAGSESSRRNKAVAPAGTEKSKERAQRRPRGNLPQAPGFDGDRRKDPKCFRKYATKVDSYVEIAKNIIDDAEIGLRLHAALDGEAADYLEDVPAKVFGVDNGWQVLLKLLRDKFDEKRMHKVGSAMKGFFKMNLSDKAYTMSEVVDLMDRAARRCRESNLTIPDEVMVFFFFEHTAMSTERQANLLLRTGGEYNWKKMKQAVELLYQNVTVKAGRDRDANQGGFRGRQRAAHETHNTNEWNADLWRVPEPHASEEQIGNWLYDHDPVEALAEVEMTEIPEHMARELHACFASHRENRQRLARAVQARGYYVGGGKGKSKSADKGKGKSSDKGKGKSKKGGGKARGMSLEELKARTACGDCGQKGHWRGDPECRGPKKANEANRAPEDGAEDEEEADDWYGEYDDGSWSQWEAQRYGYPVRRSTFETRAPITPAMSSTPSATRSSDFLAHESEAVARGINRVRKKAGIPQDVEAVDVRKALAQDSDPKVTDIRENVIDQQRAVMAESPSTEAVAKAFEHFGLDVVPHSRKGVLELLQDPDDELPDIEALRKVMAVRRVPWSMVLCPKSVPRGVQSAMRRPPTVEEGRCYLTLDTACENSVSGTTILQSIAGRMQQQFAVKPIIRPESETYCFGPGEPTMSQERWMVPIGIRGRPCVIATSSIPDQNGSKIPFLAGQDWMVFMNACLDIGRHIAIFREIGVQAPLYVDITGHLVIAIDEMPSSGWPQDLVARKDAYPGVLFEQSGRNAGATGKASGMAKHFAPTHVYEPNDASEGRPCTVAADHWEFQVDRQIYVRHHCRPRTSLFAPGDTLDGPDPKDLQPVRITWKAGAEEPVCDDWVNGVEEVSVPWVGATYFLGKGIDMSHVQFAPVSVDVPVQFADGSVQHVKPHELNCVNPKKVHHFDLKTTKPPEAPQPLRKGRFHIPAGEFGSKVTQLQPSGASANAQAHSHSSAVPSGGMGPNGGWPRGPDRPGGAARHDEHGGAQREAQDARARQLHGGPLREGDHAGDSASDGTSSDDEPQGPGPEGGDRAVPTGSGTLSASSGMCAATRQCSRALHGVPPVRDSVVRPAVQGALHEGGDSGVPVPPRLSAHSGRDHSSSSRRPSSQARGPLKKLVRMLFVLSQLIGETTFGGLEQGIQTNFVRSTSPEHSYEQREWQADFQGESGPTDGRRGDGQPTRPSPGGARAPQDHGGAAPGGQTPPGGGRSQTAGGELPHGTPRRGEGDLRGRAGLLGGGDSVFRGPGRGYALKAGQKRRMRDQARRALEAAQVHREAVAARIDGSRWPRMWFNYDLVEIFGGTSQVSLRAAHHWNLKVLQPIDSRYGIDLRRPEQRRWLKGALAEHRPRLVVIGFPCTPWKALQTTQAQRQALLEDDKIFQELACELFREQRSRGGHVIAEYQKDLAINFESECYVTPRPLRVRDYARSQRQDGSRLFRLIATHPVLIENILDRCSARGRGHADGDVGGDPLEVLPPALGDAVCRSYLDLVATEDYGFASTWATSSERAVHYVDVKREEDAWRPLLQQAEELLGRKVQASLLVHPDTDLYRKVQDLVPWQLALVQVAHLPKAKRVKAGLEECHRASVLLLNDDTIVIETEYLKEAQAPRERFVTPVRYAIFVLGYAPGEPKGPSPAQPPPVQVLPGDELVRDEVQEGLVQEGLVRQDFAGECWFIGGPLREKEKALARALVRMHRNLGHPRMEDMIRALAQSNKVDPEAVSLCRRLRCATCERTRRPLPPRPTSLKVVGQFNSKVCLDFVHIADAEKVTHRFLHILEPNGSFNLYYPSKTRQPEDVLSIFCDVWSSWAGFPDYIHCDQDGAFEGAFLDKMRHMGVEVEMVPAEAHWQAGQVEAYNRAFRYAAEKAVDEFQLVGELDMKILGAMVSASLNEKVKTCGCSANQWVFGKDPKMPWDLLSPDGRIEALQGLDADYEIRRRQQVRAASDQKIAEFTVNDSLRRAVLRQGRPTRQSYEPGELVAFWREAKMKKDPRTKKPRRVPGGWYKATVIGPHRGDEGQSNYWLSSGGRCILAAKEQLRPAFGTELWRIQEDVLRDLLDKPPEEYHDERGVPPGQGVAEDPGEVLPAYGDGPDEDYEADEEGERDELPLRGNLPGEPRDDLPGELPTEPSGEPRGDLPEELPAEPSGEPRGPLDIVPVRRGAGDRERSPRRGQASKPPSDASDATQPSPVSPLRRQPLGIETIEPEAKRVRVEVAEETGQDRQAVPLTNRYIPVSAQEIFAKPSEKFQGSILEPGVHRGAQQTRKEQKALEKEIPYSMIEEQDKQAYHEALVKEWGTWQKYEAVAPLSPEASKAVEAQFPPERILPSRVCYRNKNAAFKWLPLKAKARLVCRGDQDPDLLELRRDAPTMTRMSLMVLMQLAASFRDWFLFTADVTGAFLQGDQGLASRQMPLFIRQPREGLPGLLAGQLLLVVRGIFGLANSPRLFWRHLRDTLKSLGFVQSTLDKALFCFYKENRLILALGTHVDDLLGAGKPGEADEVLERVKAAFDFGAWADSRHETVLEYGGKQLAKLPDGTVTLSQNKFIQAIDVTPVPRWRAMTPTAPLSGTEATELRSGGGCLHWLIGQTRPDLAAGTSLYMSGQPTVQNLVEVNKLMKEAKASQDWCLRFVPIDLETAKVVVFTDASWANAPGLKSQAGYLTFLTGPDVFTPGGDAASLLDWRSRRIQRQCRSTLAAETMSLDCGFDSGIFVRELLAETLVKSYSPIQSGQLPPGLLEVHPITDCRSLYDLLTKDGPVSSTQEKRLTIDVEAIKQSAAEFDVDGEELRGTFKWVDTTRQLADHLTKVKPAHLLRDQLSLSHLALQELAKA